MTNPSQPLEHEGFRYVPAWIEPPPDDPLPARQGHRALLTGKDPVPILRGTGPTRKLHPYDAGRVFVALLNAAAHDLDANADEDFDICDDIGLLNHALSTAGPDMFPEIILGVQEALQDVLNDR